jgi:hypothetical protein
MDGPMRCSKPALEDEGAKIEVRQLFELDD